MRVRMLVWLGLIMLTTAGFAQDPLALGWEPWIFHLHSNHSDGHRTVAENGRVSNALGYTGLAFTDHFDLLTDPASYLADLANCPANWIVGTEITYRWKLPVPDSGDGHLLVLSDRLWPNGKPDPELTSNSAGFGLMLPSPDHLGAIVSRVRVLDPDALVIAAHPHQPLYLFDIGGLGLCDGIEFFNSGSAGEAKDLEVLLAQLSSGKRLAVTAGCDSHNLGVLDELVVPDSERWKRLTIVEAGSNGAKAAVKAGRCYAAIEARLEQSNFKLQLANQTLNDSNAVASFSALTGSPPLPEPQAFMDGRPCVARQLPPDDSGRRTVEVPLPQDGQVHSLVFYLPGRLITSPCFVQTAILPNDNLTGHWQGKHTLYDKMYGQPIKVYYEDQVEITLLGGVVTVIGHTVRSGTQKTADWQAQFISEGNASSITLTRQVDITRSVGKWYEWVTVDATVSGDDIMFTAIDTRGRTNTGTWHRVSQ